MNIIVFPGGGRQGKHKPLPFRQFFIRLSLTLIFYALPLSSSSQIHVRPGSSRRSSLGFPQAHSEVRRVKNSVWQNRVLSGREYYCNFEQTVEDSRIPQGRFVTVDDAMRFGWDITEGTVDPSEGLKVFETYGIDEGEARTTMWKHMRFWDGTNPVQLGIPVSLLLFRIRLSAMKKRFFNIAVDALRRRGVEQIPSWSNPATFRPDDDDEGFYAMLGEARGAGAAFVLNQHNAELGQLRINEIHVWAEDDDFDTRQEFTDPNDPALYMWMTIERVQTS
ncbi:hypothetical protein S7711_11578 [Stachybotrys chartarum IBT 7711]|uniref:Uncharacterized protein n=1 Tax=Stachybotrys chartarum (strain CBS 109288 / IBT 7711) TaxID=1280523 RepID=A0A084B8M8_STACB|nr:hypothetical protein S7711_11578 [Stachybotrys chartarum IBT 7711]